VSYGDEPARDPEEYDGPAMSERERELRIKKARRDEGTPPVERAFGRCQDAATRLSELAENLHARLGPVLGPDRPEPAMGEVRQEEDYSPLTGRLEGLADGLEAVVAQLLRTTRRIEL
jgi:hypothetical protein